MKSTNHTPENPAVAPLYLTEEAAAARYSFSVNFIRRLRYAGKLKAIAIRSRCVRYSVASLDAYFDALAQGGDAAKKGAARGSCNAWRARVRPKSVRLAGNAGTEAAQ